MRKIVTTIRRISRPIQKMEFNNKTLYIQKGYVDDDEVIHILLSNSRLAEPIFTISTINGNVFKALLKTQDFNTYVYRYGDRRILDSYGGSILVSNRVRNKYDLSICREHSGRLLTPIVSWKDLSKYQIKEFFYPIFMMAATNSISILSVLKKAE